MFRSSRKSYWSSQAYQKKKALPKRWVLLSIPLAVMALELLVRLVVGVSGKTAELNSFEGEPLNLTAYRLKFLDQTRNPYDGLPNWGQLMVKRSPIMGYRLVSNQKNTVWQINEQGFRADQAVPIDKPKDEVRVFILGGSTAFGQLSANNQSTIAGKLEARLNQQVAAQKAAPGKFRPDILPYYADELDKVLALQPRIRENRYRVINAAVPGYVSSNELSQLAFEILAYKPDFIVLLNGYSDLLLPSTYEGADVPGTEAMLGSAPRHLMVGFGHQLQSFFRQLFLVRGFEYWVLRPQTAIKQMIPPSIDSDSSLKERLPKDSKELGERVDRYRQNLQHMARLTAGSKVPLIVALQPEISSRKPEKQSAREKEILARLGSDYPQHIKEGYTQLQSSIEQVKRDVPQGLSSLNVSDAYKDYSKEAFQDVIHLTDDANSVMADWLFDSIANKLHVQPRPYAGNTPPAQ
jgi:hypothetical protein